LLIGNNSPETLWFEFGSARATATLTSGAVSSVSVTNAGFNFSKAPVVEFLGGGSALNGSYLGLNQPNGATPSAQAKGHAVLSGTTLGSIVVDYGGSGYVIAPFVFIYDSDLDPYGCAVPSNGVGIQVPSGSPPLVWNGTVCPTDSIAVWGATTGDAFMCKWME
jgi:hypothetical protein